MVINLLDILKTIPSRNFENIGYAISLLDIYDKARLKGITNTELIIFKLRELADNHLIELCGIDPDFDESIFTAVRLL